MTNLPQPKEIMRNWTEEDLEKLVIFKQQGLTWEQINEHFPAQTPNSLRKTYYRYMEKDIKEVTKPRILLLDIETKPIIAHVWSLWENNVGLNQIEKDWSILSWSAKWLGEDEIFYQDLRDSDNIDDDSELLKGIWKLLDEADIAVGHNIKSFDDKKLSARFIENKFRPPSSYRIEDTKILAQARFGFPSNKLEYLTNKLCLKNKKLSHAKFPGHMLWTECMKGNLEAWKEMEEYNKVDVLALEELYMILKPWDKKGCNVNVYHDSEETFCTCGSIDFAKNGFAYTNTGKFQKYTCKKCGAEIKGRENLLSKEKRKSLKKN